MNDANRYIIILAICSILCLITMPFIGDSLINPFEVMNPESTDNLIFWRLRLPRTLGAFLTGAGLSLCGLVFQALFRNPLATPFTLGISSGAALGASLYLRLGASISILGMMGSLISALLGCLLSMVLVYGITRARGVFSTTVMLLAGVIINFFFSSLVMFVQYMSNAHDAVQIMRWLMGTLVGGVVNIIPKHGGKHFHLSAEAGYGTWNAWRTMDGLSGKIKMFDFAGSVTWNAQRNNYTTGDGKLYQDTEADGRLGYLLNLGVNINDENRIGAIILGGQDLGLGLSQEMTKEQKYNGMGICSQRVNSSFDITYDGGYKPAGLSWKMRYFNAYDQFKVIYPDNYILNSQYYTYNNYIIENNQNGGQGQVSWNWNFLTITGGMDYTESEYSSGFAPRYKQTDTAGWGLFKMTFFDEMFIINGGLRYDAYTIKVDGENQDMDNTSLSAGIVFNPCKWLTMRANIGESYKVPSGLYVVGYEGPNGVKGNSDLKPEKGLTWDVGLEARWQGLRTGLTYFATEYRDKILSMPLDEMSYSSIYYNEAGKSFINGLEGNLSFDLGEFYDWEFMLRPYLNFTKLFEYKDSDGERLKNTRELTASFGLNFNHPEWGLDADLRFTYLGFQHEYNFSVDYPYPEVRTGDKLVGDFFISKTIYEAEDRGKLSVKGEISNFTNENYAYRYDYPMPGRSFYVGIRYEY